MDAEGYPDEGELKYIREFDVLHQNPLELVEYIKQIWWYGDDCVTVEHKLKKYGSPGFYNDVRMVTCGWSGNEDIIRALKENQYFFTLYHTEWKRGGLWVFEIPDYNIKEDEPK